MIQDFPLRNESRKENTGQNHEQRGLQQPYLRFKLDGSPISPRVPLGTENAIFWNSGDEHTEEGHITEDPIIRNQMMNKRMTKLDVALKEISDEDKAVLYDSNNDGHPKIDADITIISWGSTRVRF